MEEGGVGPWDCRRQRTSERATLAIETYNTSVNSPYVKEKICPTHPDPGYQTKSEGERELSFPELDLCMSTNMFKIL